MKTSDDELTFTETAIVGGGESEVLLTRTKEEFWEFECLPPIITYPILAKAHGGPQAKRDHVYYSTIDLL